MTIQKQRIAVLGAGQIGVIIAGMLAEQGHEVTLADAAAARLKQVAGGRFATATVDASDLDALRSLLKDRDIVVVPIDNNERNPSAAARARLGNLLDRMRSEGLLVAGMIGDPDPYTATMNALQFYTVTGVVISTLPEERSGWLRQDLVSRVRKASNIDIEHIVAERDTADAA